MSENQLSIDGFLPPKMALKAADAGVSKANMATVPMFMLAVLAGAFIALGAIFATTATAGSGTLPFGVAKIIGGLVFSLGLILVIVAGAELFTGNNLIVVAWASGKVSTMALLRNWGIVYVGNFIGAILTAFGLFFSRQYLFGGGLVGTNALNIAHAKVNLGFFQAIMLGIFCNALVCLAVWLCMSARTTTDKILAILFPITAFVAAGFEHSIANMYFIPIGLLIKDGADPSFWLQTGLNPTDYTDLTWVSFLISNLFPVTIGNIIGGAGFVGLVYWAIYLRNAEDV